MLKPVLLELFERDLDRLIKELSLYKDEKHLWLTPGEVNNSAGNLTLHLIGNLKHYIGATLGNTGFIRNREEEFILKNISKDILLASIDETKTIILKVIENLPDDILEKDYPLEVFGHKMKTGFFLIHLTTHLNYHLGQISYHRRIMDVF